MSSPEIFNDVSVTFNSTNYTFGGNFVLSAPTLSLTPSSNNSVTLNWTVSSGATAYFVYTGTASGVYSTPANVGNVLTYAVANLDTFNTYYFVVTAANANGQGLPSNELSFAVTVPIPQINVDFGQIMPPIFLQSPLLSDYITAINTLMNGIQDDIALLYDQINPYNVPTQYLQDLANLIGLQLRSSSYLPSDSQRQQLINAVSWYKIKGTYASINYIALLLSLNINIRDFWCDNQSDYNSGIFSPENWFVDSTGSGSPTDLTSNYFKTPHFGIYILLNQALGTYPSQYLWNDSPFSDLQYFTEQTRPVHTVPHYFIELDCQANESGGVTNNPGNIYSSVTNWAYSSNYYDNIITQTLTPSFTSSHDWGALTSYVNITAGSIKLYTNGGTLIAQDNGSGGWTALKSGYSIRGVINYSTGSVETNITPTQSSAPYITYQQGQYDNGLNYDDSYGTFLSSITKWKLGTGNVNSTNPPGSGVNIPVLSGSGVVLKQYATYNQFIVTLPISTVQSSITEFGLYKADGTTPVFISYFPSIAKTSNEQLVIYVTINKN